MYSGTEGVMLPGTKRPSIPTASPMTDEEILRELIHRVQASMKSPTGFHLASCLENLEAALDDLCLHNARLAQRAKPVEIVEEEEDLPRW